MEVYSDQLGVQLYTAGRFPIEIERDFEEDSRQLSTDNLCHCNDVSHCKIFLIS